MEISMVCGILVRLWLIHFPESSWSEDTLFRHTNLDGILPLLPLLRWGHTPGSLWGPPHGGQSSSFSWTDEEACLMKNRAQFRREANQADNKAATAAVDSLINFEAVKVRKSLAIPLHSEDNEDGNYFRLVALQQREIWNSAIWQALGAIWE